MQYGVLARTPKDLAAISSHDTRVTVAVTLRCYTEMNIAASLVYIVQPSFSSNNCWSWLTFTLLTVPHSCRMVLGDWIMLASLGMKRLQNC